MRILIILLFCFAPICSAQATDSIPGEWVTPSGDSLLHVAPGGVITLLATRGEAPLDLENPDKSLRSRSIEGIVIGEGFAPITNSDSEWHGGSIYDPASGNTYRARLKLLDANHLEVHGFVGLPAFGRTEVWTRRSEFTRQIDAMMAKGGAR